MWAAVVVVALVVLGEGWAVQDIRPVQTFSVKVGQRLHVHVPAEHLRHGDACALRTPSRQDLDLKTESISGITDDSNLLFPCQINMVVSPDMNGEWVLYATSSSDPSNVVSQPFVVEIEGRSDSEETTAGDNQFYILEGQNYNANPGSVIQIRINRISFTSAVTGCELQTPSGEVVELLAGGEYPGIHFEQPNLMTSCEIQLTVSESNHGDWKMVAKESVGSSKVEVEQRFSVLVIVQATPVPESLIIEEGRDMYLHIGSVINNLDSCELLPPDNVIADIQVDSRYLNTCAFMVPGMTQKMSGTWKLVGTNQHRYEAGVDVQVKEATQPEDIETVSLHEGQTLDTDVGPLNPLYCQLRNPQGVVVFTGMSSCQMKIEDVKKEHEGRWVMLIGLAGRLIPVEQPIFLEVKEIGALNSVAATVTRDGAAAKLTCSMLSNKQYTLCQFVRPDATIFIAQEGIGEGRYSYIGTGVTDEYGYKRMTCGLQISPLSSEDVGNWRCVIDTDDEVSSSSYLRVSEPSDAAAAAGDLSADDNHLLLEELTATATSVTVVAGGELVLACALPANLHYCWFRAPNGTVISLSPGIYTESYEYVGAGLELGECGMKIHHADLDHAGTWSCNVGTATSPDVGVDIVVAVSEFPMRASQAVVATQQSPSVLVVVGVTVDSSPLEYCRYVDPAGFGFHSESSGIGSRYSHVGTNTSRGICHLSVSSPTEAELGLWHVGGRAPSGLEYMVPINTEQLEAEAFPHLIYCVLIPLLLVTTLVVAFVSVKRTRRWTSTRLRRFGSFGKSDTNDKTSLESPPAYGSSITVDVRN